MGNIELPIQIGLCTFNTYFQVMDNNPSYNCLLRRPWIHMARVIPSTHLQKVKFVVEEQLINVATEKDVVVTLTMFNPYIKIDENVVEFSFQSLKVVSVTFFSE